MAAPAPVPTVPEVTPPAAPGIGLSSLLAVVVILGIALPWGIWWLLQPVPLSPFENTEMALDYLQQGRVRSAYEIAMKLLKEKVNDPDVGGTPELIVGVANFRKAESIGVEAEVHVNGITEPLYALATRYLEQASQKTFKPELKPEWAYCLGSCYYELGRLYAARELLEVAYGIAPARHPAIMLKLADCYRDPNVLQSMLENASDQREAARVRSDVLSRIAAVIAAPAAQDQLTEFQLLTLKLRQAEIQLQNSQLADMEQTLAGIPLDQLSPDMADEKRRIIENSVVLLKARGALTLRRSDEARILLAELVRLNSGLEQGSILQAHYLTGLAYAQEGRFDLALEHLQKPAAITEADICFPANLEAGRIARKRGLHEEALAYYLRALSRISSTDDFTNRWLDLLQARAMIQHAWNEWGQSERYEHFRFASELAERVVPLFTLADAHQMLAETSRKRAEFVQRQTDALLPNVDREQLQLALDHWKRAGDAYARLADSTRATDSYGSHLWQACQLYRRGNDFSKALKSVREFIDSNPRNGLPAALIFEARLLIDLDPYTEQNDLELAADLLQRLLRDYPKDQHIYEAQMVLGDVWLESGQTEQAIAVWRELLLESPLTPDATEWQSALFRMGRTLFLNSDTRPEILRNSEIPAGGPPALAVNFEHVDEAIQCLDEFVRRNPQHSRALEARWLLAQGLKFRIQKPLNGLQTAETENTRLEHLKEIKLLAQRATEQFQILGADLAIADQKNQLTELTGQFLRDAYFEPAHIQYRLGPFDETRDAYRRAIELYGNAAFHFTGDPVVLIAYFRIAECYRELQANEEARRQLEQARVILQQLPEPYSPHSTNFNRQQWEALLEQSIRLYDLALDSKPGL